MNLSLTGRIAQRSAKRPLLTLGISLVALVIGGYFAGSTASYVTPIPHNLVTTEADAAANLDEALRSSAEGVVLYDESVIVTSDSHKYGQKEFDAAIAAATLALERVNGVTGIITPANGAPVAANGESAMISFETAADVKVVRAAVEAIAALEHDGVDTFVFGEESSLLAFSDLAAEELGRSEVFGIMAALVILVVVFGALAAAGLPIVVALVSIVTASGIGAVVARILHANDIPMSDSLSVFIAMLGLALGIDYSLLTVQRFREELAHGRSVEDAVAITGNTANRAVLISGATIVVSLGGVLFVPLNTFLGIGIGVMAVAFTSVASALFVLPAVLRLIGHRVNKGRVPTAHPGVESPRWRRIATRVTARPIVSGLIGLAILGVLATPLLSMRFASPGPDSMPEDYVTHQANDVLVEDFGWTDTQTLVAIENASDARGEVQSLVDAIEADGAFGGTTVDWRGDTAFIDTHDLFDGADKESEQAIERLRDELIPAALDGTDAVASVGGTRAYVIDEFELLAKGAPLAVGFILLVTFVLLLVMFRSIVIPIKAIILNLLGTAATFGALVAMYQWGWGSALLGFPELEGISPYMPVMIFALVFGLSMDYHVFLLSRVKERYDATGDNRAAVIEGVTRTGPLITGAALIMVAVFGGFAAASIPELSQWGFGLGFGVLLDATIIRVLLVPAAMVWLDKANWYLPRWLEWLPRFGVEPTEAELADAELAEAGVAASQAEDDERELLEATR